MTLLLQLQPAGRGGNPAWFMMVGVLLSPYALWLREVEESTFDNGAQLLSTPMLGKKVVMEKDIRQQYNCEGGGRVWGLDLRVPEMKRDECYLLLGDEASTALAPESTSSTAITRMKEVAKPKSYLGELAAADIAVEKQTMAQKAEEGAAKVVEVNHAKKPPHAKEMEKLGKEQAGEKKALSSKDRCGLVVASLALSCRRSEGSRLEA
ncbi:unnamed protein product [Amoebophrya sp. A25]|nr:unnamed protein product [Amoebophrya sp. A25]|eukprot:GSA25T00020587001.1